MTTISVYYDAKCPHCPAYLESLEMWCDFFGHNYCPVAIQDDPVSTINTLLRVRKAGHSIASVPFFVVKNEEFEYEQTYDGILSDETIKYILSKH